MKKLIFILLVLFTGATSIFSQEFKDDSVNYRAYVVTEYHHNNGKKIGDTTSVLFAFRGDIILTSIEGQRKAFYIEDEWETTELSTGHKVKVTKAYDNGGFRLGITLGYDDCSETVFIILAYNNLSFFYEVNKEEIKIEEEIFLYKDELVTYTNEEVKEFLSQYGNPNLIFTTLMFSLWFSL